MPDRRTVVKILWYGVSQALVMEDPVLRKPVNINPGLGVKFNPSLRHNCFLSKSPLILHDLHVREGVVIHPSRKFWWSRDCKPFRPHHMETKVKCQIF